MTDHFMEFASLPEEYQDLISLAQKKYQIAITPLQLLVGGFSGAVVFLVSVHSKISKGVEHSILKLDHKGRHAKADEWTRHTIVMEKASPQFREHHLPELVFDRVENENAIGIFYRIAGQSLLKYLPLSKFTQQSQIAKIFTATNTVLLSEWNANLAFNQGFHPQRLLQGWLGFRLDSGGKIEQFIQKRNRVNPDIPGFLINGNVFPNPLFYARSSSSWGDVRPIDVATGKLHRDLNTNNILVKFSEDGDAIDGYYLIDFALFKEDMPLLFDHRYLEMSYLLHSISKVAFDKVIDLITMMADTNVSDQKGVPIEMLGVSGVIAAARDAFTVWVEAEYPSLQDDLWGQYWLAGVAAGLSYTHKADLPDTHRLAGLIFAAANLKRFLSTFKRALPTDVVLLYDQDQPINDLQGQSKATTPHNLPVPKTPFVGRESEIAAIKELLLDQDIRLVTLIGAGGTGKTRLSLKVAQEVLNHFQDGVFFVPLADDTEENQLISRIAKRLNVREGGRPLVESLKDYLSDKNMLLVLDNFEQLVTFAPIIGDILATAPGVNLMVTSRIALNLQAEQRFPVPPLKLPKMEDSHEVEKLVENESVKLFIHRAQANTPNFSLTDQNAKTVAEICHRLDGLPLAIELAAARIRLLPPQAILNRLDERLKLLTGGERDLPARHQTLRNALAWSYELLSEDEKTLFARLSVFSGGFSLDAAEEICNPDGHLDILENLTALVDNSLITRKDAPNGEPRFGMLETIREFATMQIMKRDESEILRNHHAKYFGQIVIEKVSREIYSAKAKFWLDWVERELDNLRAALAWSLTPSGDIRLGVQVVFGLIWFWYRRGYLVEGLMWAERMLGSPIVADPSPLRALALQSAGLLAIWKGEQDKGLEKLQESLMLYQRAEEDPWIAPAMMSNAVALLNMGQDQAAHPLLVQARKIFKETGNDYFLTITLVHLGNVELGLGNPEKARRILEEAQSHATQLDENWIKSFVINNLGEVARVQGEYDLARTYYQECMILLENTGDRGDMARFVHSLGYLDQHEGHLVQAESQFRKGLDMFRRLGNRRGIAECLAGLAGLKARQGEPHWGATMLAAAERLLRSTGGAWWPADRVEVEANLAYMQSVMDQAKFKQAWNAGKAMNIDQAIAFSSHDS